MKHWQEPGRHPLVVPHSPLRSLLRWKAGRWNGILIERAERTKEAEAMRGSQFSL
jgi:hypothetical protein